LNDVAKIVNVKKTLCELKDYDVRLFLVDPINIPYPGHLSAGNGGGLTEVRFKERDNSYQKGIMINKGAG
jgi:hypothetical protein